jgi:SNF2 family DNA or RNA helicase
VEEKILQLQKHKHKLSENLIQSEESVIKALTREDIEILMS